MQSQSCGCASAGPRSAVVGVSDGGGFEHFLGGQDRGEQLVRAGYLTTDEPVLDGFARQSRRELDGWAADLHERL